MQYIPDISLCFVHVPKTCGSFVENELNRLSRNYTSHPSQCFAGHAKYEQYMKNEKTKNFNIFAIVRNPYDRLISCFNYIRRSETNEFGYLYRRLLNSPSDINEFVARLEFLDTDSPFLISQYKWLSYENQLPLIIKYENFKDDISKLECLYNNEKLVIDSLEFLKSNYTYKTYDVTSILNERSIEIANTIYKDDFEKFGYNKKSTGITPESLIDKIVLLKENSHYRFGDVVKMRGYYWSDSQKEILNDNKYKQSILHEYLKIVDINKKTEKERIKNLANISLKKIQNVSVILPKNNELVIHLRLGDVVEVGNIVCKNYNALIERYITNHNISHVTFCTCFHYGNYVERGLWIYSEDKHKKNIVKVKKMLVNVISNFENRVKIDVKSSNQIDDDFLYMIAAKHFERDFGGFSELIMDVRSIINN